MKKMTWRAYTVTEEREVEQALAHDELTTGEKPVWAQVSEKAPGELVEWVARTGLEVVRGKGMLPHDVWLTHEAKAVESQAHLSLFGEV
ncbi:hypothetical protein [Bellilinea sp.]|uniref:hypothetical protein n=1 Tax=Bellilinea sp. TaxID=2838785 RepID=UPI002ADDF199|nr:hypothetical protein [Bellilinea sp.]